MSCIVIGPAVERLVAAIRRHLPRQDEPDDEFPLELPNWNPLCNLVTGAPNAVAGATVCGTYADLLDPNHRAGSPDAVLRARMGIREVAFELEQVRGQFAQADPTEYQSFRLLWAKLLSAPLYSWRWDGRAPATKPADGIERPAVPAVEVRLFPFDDGLLSELLPASKIRESQPPLAAPAGGEQPPATQQPTSPARLSDDASSAHWYGQDYTFTATQAACVKVLWRNWDNGTPFIRQETILERAGAESQRLVDIFKHHPAWDTMIKAGKPKGTFGLVAPE
jgi:hypothetical protein